MLFGIPMWVYFLALTIIFIGVTVWQRQRMLKTRQAAFKSIHDNLKVGQHIVAGGFLHGTLRSVDGYTAKIEVAEGVLITIDKFAVTRIIDDDAAQKN